MKNQPLMRIADEEASSYHNNVPQLSQQQQQCMEEYGTEGMEYTPSVSSNHLMNYQLSDPSAGRELSDFKNLNIENEEDAIIKAQYDQVMSSHSKPDNKSLDSVYGSRGSLPQHQTPGFQSLKNSSQQMNLPQNMNQQQMIERLSAKLRQQAERLQFLENYKVLCERRVKDFDPSHAFPIVPSHLGQRLPQSLLNNNSQNFIQALQQRNSELQQDASAGQDLKRRLLQAQESLRHETLANEEQRAYIQVLRETLESKIQSVGLSFKGSNQVDSNVEGYIQLLNSTRQNEQLKQENSKLHWQLQEAVRKQNETEQQLQSQYAEELSQLQAQSQVVQKQFEDKVSSIKEKKKQLKLDKNSLLDFVEETVQKAQKDEEERNQLLEQIKQKESDFQELESNHAELKKAKEQLDELLIQVQSNLKQMREDKEELNAQIVTLQSQKEELRSELEHQGQTIQEKEELATRYYGELRVKDKQMQDKQKEVAGAKAEKSKEGLDFQRELRFTQGQLKDQEKRASLIREQLDDQTIKNKALQDSNNSLTNTLRETQEELDRLVTRHESLSKAYKQQEKEFLQIKKRLSECENELAERTKNYNEIKQKDRKREKEIQDLYSSLGQKDKVVNQCEKRLVKSLKEKEQECSCLAKQVEQLEAEMRENTNKVEFLEQMNDDRQSEIQKLKKTIDLKKTMVEDMQTQLTKTREELELDRMAKDRTMNLKLNDQQRKELELNYRLTQTQDEMKALQEQKQQAEKMLIDKIENLRAQEIDMLRKEEKLNRWEKDMERLEKKVLQGNEMSETLQVDYERVRSQRVDDAMLIDKLRSQQTDLKDVTNEITGYISNFMQYLDIQAENREQVLSKDIEKVYEIGSRLKPLSNPDDLKLMLRDIKAFISTQVGAIKKLLGQGRQLDQVHSPPQKDTWYPNQHITTQSIEEIRQLQTTNDNLRQGLDQVQSEKQKSQSLKKRVDQLEDQLSHEKTEKINLENIIRRLVKMQCFNTNFKRVMSDLLQNNKDLVGIRMDKASLVAKLEIKEQRYHTLNKSGNQALYQREIVMLKGAIERERKDLNDYDLRINEAQRRQNVLFEELMSIDSVSLDQRQDKDIEHHGLLQQIEELQKLNIELRQDKQWSQKRLTEVEDQLTRFNINPQAEDPMRHSRGAPLRSKSPQKHLEGMPKQGESQSRLQWPRQLANDATQGFTSRWPQQVQLQPSSRTTKNQLSDNFRDQPLQPSAIEESQTMPNTLKHNKLKSRVPTTDSINLESYVGKAPLQRRQDDDYSSGNCRQTQEYPVRQDLGNNYNSRGFTDSKHDQSVNGQDQSSVSLKDKIQQVKTLFSSLRQNCIDD